MEGGGAGRGRGFRAHGGHARQAEAVGDLGGDVRPVLELLRVHDSDLQRVEIADLRVGERAPDRALKQIEDVAEDTPCQVDLGESDGSDVDFAHLAHGSSDTCRG